MAGGTWIDQNKVLPGVYINYSSVPSTLATMGERGVVCIGRELNWGESEQIIEINDPSECFEKLGYDQLAPEMIWFRQLLLGTNRTSGASKVLVWRLATSGGRAATKQATKNVTQAAATVTLGNLVVTAKTAGSAGNKLSAEIVAGASSNFTVNVYNDGTLVKTVSDQETVAAVISNGTNDYVTFSGSGDLALAARASLTGGADAFVGLITPTARYEGTRGNDISVIITADPDNSESFSKFYVQTLVSGKLVDSQTLSANAAVVPWTGLNDNEWVTFPANGKSGNVFATDIVLTAGQNGTVTASAYSDFLAAIELVTWNVLVYGGTDSVIKSAVSSFVQRLSNAEGKKVQAVLYNYPTADNECVVSVYPQVITDNTGHTFTTEEMACWIGGCTAGANVNESLTYAGHPDAVSIAPVLTQTQQIDSINAGQLALFEEFGSIKVLQDNNTFTTFAATKGKQFRKNRVIRTVFGICNDTYKTYSQYYIGVTNNDAIGRGLLKAELINLLLRYQGNGAIQNVVESDVTVNPGEESDAVVIELYIQPVDSIEKIYINITIS